jgi:hypothetical protein
MLTLEQREELARKARNCRDNARADRLVAEAFREEYMRGISGHPEASKETHTRAMELYDFVIGGERRARDYERDAELFENAANPTREE